MSPIDPAAAKATQPAARRRTMSTRFIEDYQVLTTLNAYYGGRLLLVESLFAAAQGAGIVTAAIGKSGAAYIQDPGQGGYVVDENTVKPRSLVTELQTANIALPIDVTHDYTGRMQ